MSFDLFWAVVIFSFVMTFTPGPNTMMLLASGVNFGFRATVPHMAGITLGAGFLTLILGMGLGEIFKLYPLLYTMLGYAGAAYMLYLAWKIATTQSIGESRSGSKPFTFLQAAAFQWVNPKAWVHRNYNLFHPGRLYGVGPSPRRAFHGHGHSGLLGLDPFRRGAQALARGSDAPARLQCDDGDPLVLSLLPALWHG